ncbi:hypothetical protein FGO68_gene981 [Halteria grandinella]|uniref:Uncharacterized protein n=1 Tax=Halteria grandinella TaxID=5974 RepID=A0A8J8NPT9_HALGN|nr:hypothetical protein FGO68_gene981 [Halteria grandinella]
MMLVVNHRRHPTPTQVSLPIKHSSKPNLETPAKHLKPSHRQSSPHNITPSNLWQHHFRLNDHAPAFPSILRPQEIKFKELINQQSMTRLPLLLTLISLLKATARLTTSLLLRRHLTTLRTLL